MPSTSNSEGDEIAQQTLAGIREFSRMVGRKGPSFTPLQLDEMIRATRALLTTLEFKKRLAAVTAS